MRENIKQERQTKDTEAELSEGFVNFSNIENQSKAMPVMKSEEIIKSELKEMPLNVNSITENPIDLTEHVISEVKAEEIETDSAFEYGLSSVTRKSFASFIPVDQVNDDSITVHVNAETPQLLEIKTEPTVLNDLVNSVRSEQSVHFEEVKIEPADLGDSTTFTERCDYTMKTGLYASFNLVEEDSEIVAKTEGDSEKVVKTKDDSDKIVETEVNDSDIVVKTEVDETYMFEYPDTVTDKVNRKENVEYNDYVPYTSPKNRNTQRKTKSNSNIVSVSQKEKVSRKNKLYDTCVVDRALTHKRRAKSTKMKDVVPFIIGKKISLLHEKKRTANLHTTASSKKSAKKRKKLKASERERAPTEVLGISESLPTAPEDTSSKDINKNQFLCKCGKQCSDLKNLGIHLAEQYSKKKPSPCIPLIRSQEKFDDVGKFPLPYKCPFCEKYFAAFAFLQSHLPRHDIPKSRKKDRTCCFCGRIFLLETSFKNHLLYHTKEKPYVCTFCTQVFSQPASWGRHMRRHKSHNSGERMCINNKSAKVFHNKPSLKGQMLLHNDLPFLCHVCGKAYIEKHKLYQHFDSHVKDGSPRSDVFACLWCGQNIKGVNALKHYKSCDKKPFQPLTYTCSLLPNKSPENLSPTKHITPRINLKEDMHIVPSVMPLSEQSTVTVAPMMPIFFISAPSERMNHEGIPMRSSYIPNTRSKTIVTEKVSNSKSTEHANSVFMPITSTLINLQPTNTSTIPVTTSIPSVHTSSMVKDVTPELTKMYVVKFNFTCKWCKKTFKLVEEFKCHTYKCKLKNMLAAASEQSESEMDIALS